MTAHRVVIVGGGFGGLQAALGLRKADVEITLIDRRNFHLFQPVAMQQGRYAAKAVRTRLQGHAAPPFRYRDKGNLATIGRAAAVADIKGVKLSGFLAWITWLLVHLFYLIGFQNRLLVVIRWSIGFATRGRGTRLITSPGNVEAAGPAADASGGVQDERFHAADDSRDPRRATAPAQASSGMSDLSRMR